MLASKRGLSGSDYLKITKHFYFKDNFAKYTCTDFEAASRQRVLFISPSVCPSVTFVPPAKAVGRNETPLGMDACLTPIAHGARSSTGKKRFGRSEPGQNVHCMLPPNRRAVSGDAAQCQLTLALVIIL